MFKLEQINDIHDRFGSKGTLPEYLHALNSIGVETYSSYIADGHSEYFGKDGRRLISSSVHEVLEIAAKSNKKKLVEALNEKDYLEMSKKLAASGIEKWTFDTNDMTIAYSDKSGVVLLKEVIK